MLLSTSYKKAMLAKKPKIKPYKVSAESELVAEHALISEFIEEANAGRGPYYYDMDLKSIPTGKQLLDAKPAATRLLVVAAIEQARHWDEIIEEVSKPGRK